MSNQALAKPQVRYFTDSGKVQMFTYDPTMIMSIPGYEYMECSEDDVATWKEYVQDGGLTCEPCVENGKLVLNPLPQKTVEANMKMVAEAQAQQALPSQTDKERIDKLEAIIVQQAEMLSQQTEMLKELRESRR